MNKVIVNSVPLQDGRLDKLTSLLDIDPDCVNARCPSSGDTPLIIAARAGDTGVLKLLLKCGADVTMQNDLEETALDVASADIKKMILGQRSAGCVILEGGNVI